MDEVGVINQLVFRYVRIHAYSLQHMVHKFTHAWADRVNDKAARSNTIGVDWETAHNTLENPYKYEKCEYDAKSSENPFFLSKWRQCFNFSFLHGLN